MQFQRLFAALVAISAAAQQQPQAPLIPDGGVARFSTTSNLVIVDVTVKDKSGKVLNNLKSSDFTVTEDGKPQKLVVFEFEQLAAEFEPPPPLKLADQLELPPVPTTNITLPAPGQIQYHNKRLMIFYFDFSSMAIPDQLRAQTAALEFLSKNITKDDMVSIMLYTSQLQVKTDFTSDRDLLSNIINKLPIGEMSELAGLADDGSENGEDTGAAFVADETEFNLLNTDMKLGALEKAAKQLAGLPEKKDLIYFSGGVSTKIGRAHV